MGAITIQTLCDSLLCLQVLLWAALSPWVRMTFPCDFLNQFEKQKAVGVK